MGILTRYVATTFLRHLVLTLVALVGLVVVANLFGDLEDAFSGWRALVEFADRTARSLPAVVEMLLPMVVLLATLFTFAGLSRNSELTAMKVGGCSPWRLLRPIAIVLIPVAAAAYVNQNYLHPWLNPPLTVASNENAVNDVWRANAQSFYYVGRTDRHLNRIYRAQTFRAGPLGEHFNRVQRLGTGVQGAAGWRFQDTQAYRRENGRWILRHAAMTEWSAEAFPDVFTVTERDPHHIPFLELYQQVRRLEGEGRRVAAHWLEWYYKPAAVFALFVMALLGGALVQSSTRRGRLGLETTVTILVGVLFWLTGQIFVLLGKGEFIAPAVAAWSPAVAFFLLGYGFFRGSF